MAKETFNFVASKGVSWLECRALASIPWLIHAFGTRQGGEANAAARGIARNRRVADPKHKHSRFLQVLGAGSFPLALLHQTHSSIVYSASPGPTTIALEYQRAGNPQPPSNPSPGRRSGDGLMTEHPGILLGVRVADCMPILIVDPERRAIAAIHAGWRGALKRIVEKTAGEMCRVFNSRPKDLIAAVGPSIRQCCYEVGLEVVAAFSGTFPTGEEFFSRAPSKLEDSPMSLRYKTLFSFQAPPGHQAEEKSSFHLDLAAIARWQLEQAGVLPEKIFVADYCTACRTDLFYSYRKEGTFAGRMMAVIGIRQPGKNGASKLRQHL